MNSSKATVIASDDQLQSRATHDFSESQLKSLTLVPRGAAFVSLICATIIARLAWRSRTRLYHRLMFCLSMHLILMSLCHIVGTAAMPLDTPNAWGAKGNVHTCTAQGFGLQVSLSVHFYYVCLSIYSYLAVRSNFDVQKYLWVEKWIHGIVHLVSLGTAFILLEVEAFNASLTVCWIDSLPFGCGDDSVPCERGPQNIMTVATLCAGLPAVFCLLFPTFLMLTLYSETRKRQASIQIEASAVAKQASLYLLALYWSYLFNFVNAFIWWKRDKQSFIVTLLASVTFNLLGVWILAIYLYFRVVPTNQHANNESKNTTKSENALHDLGASATVAVRRSFTFNIFDGTNATGDFADFIHEGDSDDERQDHRESVHWQTIQDFIR